MDAKLTELGGLEPVGNTAFIPMTEEEIKAVEERVGAPLPEGYRRHLASFGTSRFRRSVRVVAAGPLPPNISRSGKAPFSHFYGPAIQGQNQALSLAWNVKMFAGRMPDTLMPMGSAGGGDQFAIGVRGHERGKVYYWDHEHEGDEEDYLDQGLPVPDDLKLQNVHLVAESFEDFIHRLEVAERAG